jgi:hypothetical protein
MIFQEISRRFQRSTGWGSGTPDITEQIEHIDFQVVTASDGEKSVVIGNFNYSPNNMNLNFYLEDAGQMATLRASICAILGCEDVLSENPD